MYEQNNIIELAKVMSQRFLEEPNIQLETKFDEHCRIKQIVFRRNEEHKSKCVSDGEIHKEVTISEKEVILEEIVKVERVLGITAKLNGYKYIKVAVILLIQDITLLNSVEKWLYCKIAEECNSTIASVEDAIRYAIEASWNRGNPEKINEIFGYDVSCSEEIPTNAEYLVMLTDYIKRRLHLT